MAAGRADSDFSALPSAVCVVFRAYNFQACPPIERKRDLPRDEGRDRFDQQ
jgi:hypothetical protein